MTDPVVPERIRPPLEAVHAANANNDRITPTDLGNTKMFVRRFGDTVRYSPETEQWYIWSGTHWAPDVLGQIFEMTEQVVMDIRAHALTLPDEGNTSPRQVMLAHASRTESEAARRRIISSARSHPRLAIHANKLDIPDDTVTCPNGVVDLNTGEVKPHDPSRLTTACTAVDYVADARSDLLDEWCETFMPDRRDQRALWVTLGRALRSGNETRALPIFLGLSTSGKSQLVGAVARVLQGYATTINASVFRGNLDDRPRPDLMRAVRSRVAFAHEAAQTWDMHGDHVKKLTGMDTIPVRTHFKEIVEIQPTFTPIIVANEMPRVKGADEALKRRLVIIKFGRPLAEELVDPRKRRIFEYDPATQRALLARIIAGARDSLDLTSWSEEFVAARAEAFDEVDHVGQFLQWLSEQGHLIKSHDDTPALQCVKASSLHDWYIFWVRRHGDRADRDSQMNLRAFGKALRARGWESAQAAGTRWIGWQLRANAPWL